MKRIAEPVSRPGDVTPQLTKPPWTRPAEAPGWRMRMLSVIDSVFTWGRIWLPSTWQHHVFSRRPTQFPKFQYNAI